MLRECLDIAVEGFAEIVFDGCGVYLVCREEDYVVAVLGEGVCDGDGDEFSAAVNVKCGAEDADFACH